MRPTQGSKNPVFRPGTAADSPLRTVPPSQPRIKWVWRPAGTALSQPSSKLVTPKMRRRSMSGCRPADHQIEVSRRHRAADEAPADSVRIGSTEWAIERSIRNRSKLVIFSVLERNLASMVSSHTFSDPRSLFRRPYSYLAFNAENTVLCRAGSNLVRRSTNTSTSIDDKTGTLAYRLSGVFDSHMRRKKRSISLVISSNSWLAISMYVSSNAF